MRIILANKFYYPRGGDCIHAIGLKKMLEENGHKVAIFTMQHPKNLQHEYSRYWPSEINYSSKSIKRAKEAIFRPIYSNEVATNWNNLLDDFQPDIVHLHNIHSQLSPVIAEESHKKNIPVLWTLHDYKPICPAYTFTRNGKVCEECLTDKKSVIKHRCIKNSLIGSFIGHLESIKWSAEKLGNITTRFISPSKFLKSKMVEGGFQEKNISQIYNFIDDEKFKPVLDRENYVVYLGRLSHEKGVETLLKAVSQDSNIVLKVIGDGPLRTYLEDTYDSANIDFLGFQNWNMIEELLGKASCMVVPSEWYENNSLSVIEALALGTPVLGSNIGGIPEMINNENGKLFETGNSENLLENLHKIISDDSWDYDEISKAAKQKCSSERYFNAIIGEYSSAMTLNK